MIPFVALLLATPVYGFALQAPVLAAPAGMVEATASLGADVAGVPVGEGGGAPSRAGPEPAGPRAATQDDYATQTRRRNDIADIHRPMGIATWAAMTATVGLGFIQYYNKFGFFAGQGSNPCVTGDAVFGQGQCSGVPVLHMTAASVTTALYATTFTLSLMMPDPDDLSSAPGEFASTLRMHKLLRWIHFGGMVAQLALGVVIATDLAGLDRANDYGTQQALATVHMGLGLVTWGALTWAGALMTL